MTDNEILPFINDVLKHIPEDWLKLTTHRLDIYNEKLAKTEFITEFEAFFNERNSSTAALNKLPTAYDYIRLGHPLSSILEWTIAKFNSINPKQVISFASQSMPILAILRTNAIRNIKTRIIYAENLPNSFDAGILKSVYGYNFELVKLKNIATLTEFDGSSILVTQDHSISAIELHINIDFYITIYPQVGSILLVNGDKNHDYISEIQHVRRRETIAMTPISSLNTLTAIAQQTHLTSTNVDVDTYRNKVAKTIQQITQTKSEPLIGSSGLSVQYAIMMGLIDNAQEKHPGKAIKFIVPTNCYGGTNDQARRVAAVVDNVTITDLLVDREHDMVESLDRVLIAIANEDAVPYIIAEIPTNPRVEVPDLEALKYTLKAERTTAHGTKAVSPVFVLDQTFCPNVHFFGEEDVLSEVKSISYVSGSKFPSGGKCTAGYCVGNNLVEDLMTKIKSHFQICDNSATALQYQLLAEQMPSMNRRITEAYLNTREFVTFIKEVLPEAKINFVSKSLADANFTPSVFSLRLPAKGETNEEREAYRRELNLKLIHKMIREIPNESKYCVSYGQLNGCYWTIPATSTQGTTKEGDKDYIVRASLSPKLDLERHKKVFLEFVKSI